MTKEYFVAAKLPLSPAVRAGDFVFISRGVAAETRAVLENGGACLARAGRGLENVARTSAWLRDRDDFPVLNEACDAVFPHEPPARSTAESLLMIDIAVEVEAIA